MQMERKREAAENAGNVCFYLIEVGIIFLTENEANRDAGGV